MKILGAYKNGNYHVCILNDGTKIRSNNLDFFKPDFPESMDIKITNCCDMGCKFCHENSKPDGKHGDIMNVKFIENLHPFTELAIGGGNPLAHPDLVPFLEKCKNLKLIPSMTINQTHLKRDLALVKELVDRELIYGLGISLIDPSDEFIELVKQFPNAVIHVIAGIVTMDQIRKLANKGLKLLILGYKQFRRGEQLYLQTGGVIDSRITNMKNHLEEILDEFKVVSFDNLAIKQLDPKRLLTDEQYNEFFMGNDGEFSMFVDLVESEFARSSTSTERFPITDDIVDMFNIIHN